MTQEAKPRDQKKKNCRIARLQAASGSFCRRSLLPFATILSIARDSSTVLTSKSLVVSFFDSPRISSAGKVFVESLHRGHGIPTWPGSMAWFWSVTPGLSSKTKLLEKGKNECPRYRNPSPRFPGLPPQSRQEIMIRNDANSVCQSCQWYYLVLHMDIYTMYILSMYKCIYCRTCSAVVSLSASFPVCKQQKIRGTQAERFLA
jgi:hypothetical protein